MATRTTTSDFTNATDAQFRAWGKWFRDCFSTFGWVLVGTEVFNTGSDWTTVTTPSAANQSRVEPIFRMADASQSTAPFYIKLFIGSGSAAGSPGFRMIIGTGVSGSTITGQLLDTGTTHLTFTATTQIMSSFASGDTNRISISMQESGTSWGVQQQLWLTIERRKNSSGADQTTGFLVTWMTNGTKRSQGFLATAAGTQRLDMYSPIFTTGAVFDGKSPTTPLIYDMGPPEIGLNVIVVLNSEWPVGSTLTPTVLGSSHTYRATQINATGIDGTSGNLHYAYRYE